MSVIGDAENSPLNTVGTVTAAGTEDSNGRSATVLGCGRATIAQHAKTHHRCPTAAVRTKALAAAEEAANTNIEWDGRYRVRDRRGLGRERPHNVAVEKPLGVRHSTAVVQSAHVLHQQPHLRDSRRVHTKQR